MKRFIDLTLLFLSFPFVIPILIIVSIAVWIKLGFPMLFKQPRPGLNNLVFNMIKFRTMSDERGSSGSLLSDSERLSKFGLFLRSTSLDELPGLWSVLKGDMSLVGPRPLLVEYLPLYTVKQARRHEAKPGITGWAQVNGRNAISWDEKFDLDVWYVDNQSLWLDIKILFLTVKKVFVRDGITTQDNNIMPVFRGSK